MSARTVPTAIGPAAEQAVTADAAEQPLIELRNVAKCFVTPAGPFYALRHVELAIGEGEFVAVVGKSGSGKSTLVNMIAGIDRPSEGEVWVAGTAVHQLDENRLARWRGRTVGIVFQFFQLLPTLTVVENVMLPMDFCHRYRRQERHQRAMELLHRVGMADHAGKLPAHISGGEQQRVAIARALANDPPIVLADEPTGNLDTKTSEAVFQLFQQLAQAGKTIVMVTHDRDLAARAQRQVLLVDGELADTGDVRRGDGRPPAEAASGYAAT